MPSYTPGHPLDRTAGRTRGGGVTTNGSLRPWLLLGLIVVVAAGSIVAVMALNPSPGPTPTAPVASTRPSPTGSPPPPPPAGVTFADYAVNPEIVGAPTTSSAQSKLWYAEGQWWGALFGRTSNRLGIYRLDADTQVWADTGELIDERPFADADVLWSGSHLYIVAGGSRDSENHAIRVRRFTFDAKAARFSLDADFPVTIHPSGGSPAVMTADSAGVLWVTFVVGGRVWVTHTLENDARWSAPVAIPAQEASVDLVDVSAIVAFGPGRIGVMWTNQMSGIYFSVHEDGAPDDSWSAPESVLTGPRSDDALSVVPYPLPDGGIGVAAAVGTTLERSLDPGTLLATREPAGTWDTTLVGLIRDRLARPIVLVDPEARTIAVAATSPGAGGAIFYKRSSLDQVQFDTGGGVPLIASQTEITIDDVTSSKSPLSREAGLLVLASDRTSGRYLHGVVDLGAGPPAANPADPDRPTTPVAPPDGVAATLLRDTFESWPIGAAGAAGWYVRPEDGTAALSIVADGGDGQALRVPSSKTGVRACRDVAEVAGRSLTIRMRVRLSRLALEDATILSVRGSGGEAASLRVTNLGMLAWFDGATKLRSTTRFRPNVWYRVTARIDQSKRTYDVSVSSDGGKRIVGVSGLRWRMPAVRIVGAVCAETAGAPPAQAIDFAEVSVLQAIAS